MLVSSNERSLLKSLCSLVGDVASGKNQAFFPEQDLDRAGAPKPLCEGVV